MGKIINVQAGNDLDMFQIFKSFVHQTEKNEFFVDGTPVIENPGVAVDFRNIEHAYEIFHILGSHWGGWNEPPVSMKCIMLRNTGRKTFGLRLLT